MGETSKETRDSITNIRGERTPHLHGMWLVRADERTAQEPERWVLLIDNCLPC
jgi:hypothetical protein